MFPFFFINDQYSADWTLLGYVLTTGSLSIWQITTTQCCFTLVRQKHSDSYMFFFKLVSTKSCHTGVWYLLSPKLLDSGSSLRDSEMEWEVTILILNTTVEMEYRAIREKNMCTRAHLLHFLLQALPNGFPRRDSGALIIFITLSCCQKVSLWERFCPDISFTLCVQHIGSLTLAKNSRVKTVLRLHSQRDMSIGKTLQNFYILHILSSHKIKS